MNVNTKIANSLFEKNFVKYYFNSERNFDAIWVQQKPFVFDIFTSFQKELMRFRYFVSSRAPVLCDMFFKEQ